MTKMRSTAVVDKGEVVVVVVGLRLRHLMLLAAARDSTGFVALRFDDWKRRDGDRHGQRERERLDDCKRRQRSTDES